MASERTRDLRVRVCLPTDEEQQEQSQRQQFLHFRCRGHSEGETDGNVFLPERSTKVLLSAFVRGAQLTSVPQRFLPFR